MSNSINDGGAAFPTGEIFDHSGKIKEYKVTGMSLRDWFAGMVIGDCFSAPCPAAWAQGSHEHRVQSVAAAYLIADAMLAARTKGVQDD